MLLKEAEEQVAEGGIRDMGPYRTFWPGPLPPLPKPEEMVQELKRLLEGPIVGPTSMSKQSPWELLSPTPLIEWIAR